MIVNFNKELEYPKSIDDLRNATDSEVYQWHHYECKGYLHFLTSIALVLEYEKRFKQERRKADTEGKQS